MLGCGQEVRQVVGMKEVRDLCGKSIPDAEKNWIRSLMVGA